MSEAERYYKALSRQGKLTPEQIQHLRSDLLGLLNGKKYPKPERQIKDELVHFCGWDYHKVCSAPL